MLSNWFTQQTTGDSNSQLTCCPQGSACLDGLESLPTCADSSWVLWNATTTTNAAGYFCCLQGQIGTQNYECDSGSLNVAATLSASNLGQPVAGATISASVGVSSGITSAHSGGATATATTTKGGIGGVVSSVLAGVTGKSDASKIGMPPSNAIES